MMSAPLVIFAYNRPDHLRRTLSALAENHGARNTEAFVFIDGPKSEQGKKVQAEVIETAKEFEGAFAAMTLRISERNKGLASSVIGGVGEVISNYGRVIVIEDDAVSSKDFLSFMNEALDYYRDDASVWSVGGFTVPVALPADYQHDVIKTQRVSSYAWGTWKDRWDRIDWSVGDYSRFLRNAALRRRFNRWGNDRSGMLDAQMCGRLDSWAIRFDYSMMKHGMYNIVPVRSLISSIGRDGSGTHARGVTENDSFSSELSEDTEKITLSRPEPDERIRREFCKPFRLPQRYRAKQYIKTSIGKKEMKK